MTLFFRQAAPEDAELVHSLIQAAFAEYEGQVPVPPGALRETLDEVKEATGGGNVWLAFEVQDDTLPAPDNMPGLAAALKRGEPVGTVRYEVNPGYLYVARLAVRPDRRGQGIGRQLMQHVEREAREMGLTRIRLGTRESMPGNLAFYERLGYEIVEREPHPRGPDVIVWFEKELKGVDTPTSLQERLVETLQPLIGMGLEHVRYHLLGGDLPLEHEQSFLYLGGDVELRFEGAAPVFLSWRVNKGWGGVCSLHISSEPLVSTNTQPLLANDTLLWRACINTPLEVVDLLGWDQVPYIVRLGFVGGTVYIGSGTLDGFGDGDNLLLCNEEGFQASLGKLTDSSAAEHLRDLRGPESRQG